MKYALDALAVVHDRLVRMGASTAVHGSNERVAITMLCEAEKHLKESDIKRICHICNKEVIPVDQTVNYPACECHIKLHIMRSVLKSLREWDMLDSAADGPWAKKLIDSVLR